MAGDAALVGALRRGDEQVFTSLVERWSGALLRIALSHVSQRSIAEEIVQEAWLTMLRTLDRFEQRSALRTWVIGIVVNIARSRARAERRLVPLPDDGYSSVEPSRFLPSDHPRWPHHWAVEPAAWRTPEDDLLAEEVRAIVMEAVATLPPAQREVLVLRDLEGMTAEEACNALRLTDTNQRVLLHRARSRVRAALERYMAVAGAK